MVAGDAELAATPDAVRVLVVDDDRALCFGLTGLLRRAGWEVSVASTCEDALAQRHPSPDVILVDLRLPDGNGLELLPRLRARAPDAILLVMTGHGSIDLAVRAVKQGAEDFLTKPFEVPILVALVRRALAKRRGRRCVSHERVRAPFVPRSDAAKRLEEEVARLRDVDCSLLLLGETGTGKSFLARQIHTLGARSGGTFVDLNCAGLTRELAESELFGHERGAFTGADRAKVGLFEAADRGTLFLDEIGDIDLQVQPKILKVIEEKRFRRMGDVRQRSADVRLLAATHRNLELGIASGRFRADLFYRISTVTLTVPPLRSRAADIVPLAHHLLAQLSDGADLTSCGRAALLAHDWPGNIRELRNVLERALILRRGDEPIGAKELGLCAAPRTLEPAAPHEPTAGSMGEVTLRSVERETIRRALELEGGRVEAAARRLGIPRSTLYQKIRVFGIGKPRTRIRSAESDREGSGAA